MSLAIVQQANYNSGASSVTSAPFVLSSAPTSGNLLVAALGFYTGADPVVTGSGWTLVQNNEDDTTSGVVVFGKIAGASESTTQNPGGISSADSLGGTMYEISGAASTVGTAITQAINSHASTNVTSLATGSLTPAVLSTLAMAFCNSDPSPNNGTDTTTVSSGWTLDASVIPTNHRTYAAHRNALTSDTTTAITNTFSAMQSSVQVAILILVNPGAGGGGGTTTAHNLTLLGVGK